MTKAGMGQLSSNRDNRDYWKTRALNQFLGSLSRIPELSQPSLSLVNQRLSIGTLVPNCHDSSARPELRSPDSPIPNKQFLLALLAF